jgi:hypothetical protein
MLRSGGSSGGGTRPEAGFSAERLIVAEGRLPQRGESPRSVTRFPQVSDFVVSPQGFEPWTY